MSDLRNAILIRGDFYAFNLKFNGQVLANSTIRFTAKKSLKDSDSKALIRKSSVNEAGIKIIKQSSTEILAEIELLPSDTNNKNFSTEVPLFYDIQVTKPDGLPITVESGKFTVVPDITQEDTFIPPPPVEGQLDNFPTDGGVV